MTDPLGVVEEQVLPPRAAQRYTNLKRIGYGGMGEVFRARDEHVERDVAIKIIRQDCAKSSGLRERFRREVVVLSKISHPNVVQFYDFWDEDGCVFYTMEFVEGKKLDTLIEEGKTTIDEGVELIKKLCDGVAAVHKEGVIHRDLKPDNIIVTPDGVPKIIDFGIAKFADPLGPHQLTGTGEMVGTFRYLPPEVLSGHRADERSDVYQLALILYELITRRHPFGDCSVIDIVQGKAFDAIEVPSKVVDHVDKELDLIVTKGLELDRRDRIPNALVYRDVLTAWAIGEDTGIEKYVGTHRKGKEQRSFLGRAIPYLFCAAIIMFFLTRLALFSISSAQREGMILNNLLFTAVHRGDHEEVARLVKVGSDIHAADGSGNCPLHHAARRGHRQVVALLLELGANSGVSNKAGETPQALAEKNGHKKIVLLLQNGLKNKTAGLQ